jgi:hypothetical protein
MTMRVVDSTGEHDAPLRVPPLPEHARMRLHVGIAMSGEEAAVVAVEHRLLAPTDIQGTDHRRVFDSLVRSIIRPPADVDAVADLLAGMTDDLLVEEPLFLVYPDGLGTALHTTLAHERWLSRTSSYASLMRDKGRMPFLSRRSASLYPSRGKDQQELLDRLGDARRLGLLHFEDGLVQRQAMDRALASYDREAHDDKSIPPLVAALALALRYPRTGAQPRALGRDKRVYADQERARLAGSLAW